MIWIHSSANFSQHRYTQNCFYEDGILLIDKPYGCTSFDIIRRLKYRFRFKKIGHAGTLDPIATGLMIIVLGKATQLSQALMCGNKEYEGIIRLGVETTTYDSEGKVTQIRSIEMISDKMLQNTIQTFLGDQCQQPPMFSAKKTKGVPLYKFARKGEEVSRKPQFITIFNFELLQYAAPNVHFRILCSKGTYIRSLAHDLGQKLGCGAHLTKLRRTASGNFSVCNAVKLNTLLENPSIKNFNQYVIPYEALQLLHM